MQILRFPYFGVQIVIFSIYCRRWNAVQYIYKYIHDRLSGIQGVHMQVKLWYTKIPSKIASIVNFYQKPKKKTKIIENWNWNWKSVSTTLQTHSSDICLLRWNTVCCRSTIIEPSNWPVLVVFRRTYWTIAKTGMTYIYSIEYQWHSTFSPHTGFSASNFDFFFFHFFFFLLIRCAVEFGCGRQAPARQLLKRKSPNAHAWEKYQNDHTGLEEGHMVTIHA